MSKWNINYHNLVKEDIKSLPVKLLARYYSLIDRMKERGPDLRLPHTKSLGSGLFEMRLKAEEGIARVVYCTILNKQIWILHSFVKKTQKIPSKELKIAHNRMKELCHEK
jgi:phage-related protein